MPDRRSLAIVARLARRRWLVLVAVVALVVLSPRLVAAGLVNVGLIALVGAPACDTTWFVCRVADRPYPPAVWDGNEGQIERARGLLAAAVAWDDASSVARLHHAEALFALGRRAEAARALPPVATYQQGRSPLTHDARFEYHLVRGHQLGAAGRWADAVQAFRLGLTLGAERTLPVDEEALLVALAEMYRAQVTADPTDLRAAYLAGKYLVRAERWDEALQWLGRAASASPALTPAEAGWLHVYRGRALERQGDLAGAGAAYQAAMQAAPEVREGHARLLALLQRVDPAAAGEVAGRLAALGPGIALGRSGPGYDARQPRVLPHGWALVGYDVDGETVAAGPPLDLLLWWRAPAGAVPPGAGWVQAGAYWLQWQRVANVAPNAGFEWTAPEPGLPLGYSYEFSGAAVEQIAVRPAAAGDPGQVLVVEHTQPATERIGVVGPPVPVDNGAYYLMAGRKLESAPHGNLGRLCYEPSTESEPPYYIAYYDAPRQPLSVWIQFADLAPPFPERNVLRCKLFLIDAGRGSTTAWDDVLFARIAVPD